MLFRHTYGKRECLNLVVGLGGLGHGVRPRDIQPGGCTFTYTMCRFDQAETTLYNERIITRTMVEHTSTEQESYVKTSRLGHLKTSQMFTDGWNWRESGWGCDWIIKRQSSNTLYFSSNNPMNILNWITGFVSNEMTYKRCQIIMYRMYSQKKMVCISFVLSSQSLISVPSFFLFAQASSLLSEAQFSAELPATLDPLFKFHETIAKVSQTTCTNQAWHPEP